MLAGGEGTRLRPLTLTTPKPVMPLAGRPFLSFMLDWVHSHGAEEVILSCGFMSDAVKSVLGDIYDGMRLRHVTEDEPLGTAGPVRLAYDEGLLEERFLVLNGDVLTDIDLTAELEQHERTGARATLALYPVEETSSYGVVPTDDDGQVTEFIEKGGGEAPTNRINAGAYVLERDVVESIPAGRAVSFEREVFPSLIGDGSLRLRRRRILDRHRDARALSRGHLGPAGGARALDAAAARRDRLAHLPELPRWPARTWARRACWGVTAPWARMLASSARCSTSGCIVGADAAVIESVLAERVRVGERARVGPDAMVGANAVIEADAVVGPGRSRGAGRHRLGCVGADRMNELEQRQHRGRRPGGMLGEVLAQPLQLGDALWRAQSAGIRPRDLPGGLVVCGMGGSAIGGDLALAALGDRATRPITVVRGYALESWIPPESLVLCASYSGDTEETLACFEAAGAAGTQRVALTTGGTLAELAREEGVPVIGVPAGMQPRAAVVYMTIGALECAALCGAAPGGACRDRYGHGFAGTARRGVGSGCC